jgi:hypothetical protein
MKLVYTTTVLLTSLIVLGACATTKVEEETIVTPPPVEQTCIPIVTLKKVVIPAVTLLHRFHRKRGRAILQPRNQKVGDN